VTDNAFLGGSLQIFQPRKGYRAAIDAVCLAAAVPARPGERVLDIGIGVGVTGLCLSRRVEGLELFGLEIQADLADLAVANAKRNGIDNVHIVCGDILAPPASLEPGSFDHVLTNPPFYDFHKANSPPNESKSRAHMHSGADFMAGWLSQSIRFLKPGGALTLVHPAEYLDDLLGNLSGPLGDLVVFPLYPGNGKPAKRIIISGQKGTSGALRLLPGLQLHAPPKRYAPETEAVLRDGKGISLD
jgi:tRNA1(Val) A37 N6-methylase TrmN6